MDNELKQYLHEMRAEMLGIEKRIVERLKLHIDSAAARAQVYAETQASHAERIERLEKKG